MIIISVKETNFQFKYSGNIEMRFTKVFLIVQADGYANGIKKHDEEMIWHSRIHDTFLLGDIVSIEGI